MAVGQERERGEDVALAHVVYAPTELEGVGGRYTSLTSRRRAIVGAAIGLACCCVGMVGVLYRGGEEGSNGRAKSELAQTKLSFFGAPLIELAGKDSELFPSRATPKRAAARKHIAAAAAVLREEVGMKGREVELDAVKPLLDSHGTLNLAAVTEAVDQKLKGKRLAAGETITLHDVPTQVTLTLPEDVTITAPMIAAASKTSQLVTSQSHSVSTLGWSYGTPTSTCCKPDDWGSLKPEWKTCSIGLQQSPIDIVPSQAKGGADLPPVTWDCGGSPCAPIPDEVPAPTNSVKIAYNGRYVELTNFADDKSPKLMPGSQILQAIRLHTPSEHSIDGQYFDMEVQLIHAGKPGISKTVVSIFFQSGGGEKTPAWLENIADVISPCHLSVVRTECQISDVPHHLTSEFSFAAVAANAKAQVQCRPFPCASPDVPHSCAFSLGRSTYRFRRLKEDAEYDCPV